MVLSTAEMANGLSGEGGEKVDGESDSNDDGEGVSFFNGEEGDDGEAQGAAQDVDDEDEDAALPKCRPLPPDPAACVALNSIGQEFQIQLNATLFHGKEEDDDHDEVRRES